MQEGGNQIVKILWKERERERVCGNFVKIISRIEDLEMVTLKLGSR